MPIACRTDLVGPRLSGYCVLLLLGLMACGLARAGDTGAGFFITPDGYFITNCRTLEGANRMPLMIRDRAGSRFSAAVVATDTQHDLALLKVQGNFAAIPIARSDAVRTGDRVLAALARESAQGTATTRLARTTVSQLSGPQDSPHLFSLKISHGLVPQNQPLLAGGPLLTADGRVIGVIAYMQPKAAITDNTAYAIKSERLLALIAHHRAAWSQLQTVNATPARTYGQLAAGINRAVGLVIAGRPYNPAAKLILTAAPDGRAAPTKSNEPSTMSSEAPTTTEPAAPPTETELAATPAAKMFQTGYQALQRQDYPVALHWLNQAAEQGHATAQSALATMYLKGQGVERDAATAAVWLRKAALQGDMLAAESLGLLFREGVGVDHDDIEAAWWLQRAAKQGSPSAQVSLGMMYEEGRGVSRDDGEAFAWFKRAAERGDAQAQYRLGLHYLEGRGVSRDKQQAARWINSSASLGFAEARDHLRAGTLMP